MIHEDINVNKEKQEIKANIRNIIPYRVSSENYAMFKEVVAKMPSVTAQFQHTKIKDDIANRLSYSFAGTDSNRQRPFGEQQ